MSAVLVPDGPDAGAIWHYGDPMGEQKLLESGRGAVVLGHRDVLSISGPDRLEWLHSLTTQFVSDLAPGVGTTALVLSPQGHIEHVLYGVDDGDVFWAHTEPGRGEALVAWLQRMIFMRQVEVSLRTPDLAVVWQPGAVPEGHRIARAGADSLGGHESFIPRGHLDEFLRTVAEGGVRDDSGPRSAPAGIPQGPPRERLEAPPVAGLWAYEARRIAAGVPRIFVDTDARTIPNEIGLLGVAVHLDKGCYRGQETVARVHTLGRPPRRLVMLHLDGSMNALPTVGVPLTLAARRNDSVVRSASDGLPQGPSTAAPQQPGARPAKAAGFVGSSARHYELGPIALGLVKRNVAVDAAFEVEGIAAAQEVVVDPEIGMHVRARLDVPRDLRR